MRQVMYSPFTSTLIPPPSKAWNSAIDEPPNLNITVVQEIAQKLNLIFTLEKEPTPCTFAPIGILDYIYAVLHSPSYRAKYLWRH